MPLKKKGNMVECYLCSHNHLVKDCLMRGRLALLVEKEDARITPTKEETEPLRDTVQLKKPT